MLDINAILALIKKLIVFIFSSFGVAEEFEALGIDAIDLINNIGKDEEEVSEQE